MLNRNIGFQNPPLHKYAKRYTTEFRQYYPRLGRWLSVDPFFNNFPWQSSYVAFDNLPTLNVDPKGLAAESSGNGVEKEKELVTYNNKIKHKDGILKNEKTYNHTHVNSQKTGENI